MALVVVPIPPFVPTVLFLSRVMYGHFHEPLNLFSVCLRLSSITAHYLGNAFAHLQSHALKLISVRAPSICLNCDV